MRRFQTKPEYVDAVQWDESMATLKTLKARGLDWRGHEGHRDNPDLCRWLHIGTREGKRRVEKDDWIVRTDKGWWYVFRPTDFDSRFMASEATA